MKVQSIVSAKSVHIGAAVLLAAAALTLANPARANDVYWSVGISQPGVQLGFSNAPQVMYQRPVFVQPQPVYVQPPVYYENPAPYYESPARYYESPAGYYESPARYYAPQPAYVQPWPVYLHGRHGHRPWPVAAMPAPHYGGAHGWQQARFEPSGQRGNEHRDQGHVGRPAGSSSPPSWIDPGNRY